MTARDGHFSFFFVVVFTSTVFFLISFVLEYLFGRISVLGCNKAFISLVLGRKHFGFKEPPESCPTLPQVRMSCAFYFSDNYVLLDFVPSVELLQVFYLPEPLDSGTIQN